MRILIPALLAMLVATPAVGQNVPGFEGNYDAAAAQFRAYALENFQEVMGAWVQAVNAHQLDEVVGLYADNAHVQLEGPAQGREATRAALAEWLASVDAVQVGLADFDASGTMSFGSVRILIDGAGSHRDADGTLFVVLKRHGRDWQIRSQTLMVD